jgi:beta-glucosidase
VNEGKLTEERINLSVKRLLRQRFELGLFDNPFVDHSKVHELVGLEKHRKLGEQIQQRSMTLLKNTDDMIYYSLKKIG